MKKMWILLGLLALTLFVVSCAPKESGEEGALAGEASGPKFNYVSCTDKDGGKKGFIPSYTVAFTDSGTQVVNVDQQKGKINALYERSCSQSKYPITNTIVCSKGVQTVVVMVPEKGQEMSLMACKCSTTSDCETGYVCNSNQVCEAIPTCTLNCAGKTCGDDGCGGSCGTCPTGQDCQADGICKAQTCTPGPTGKIKCIKESSAYYAIKELQKEDCSTYDETISWNKKCGDDADSCKEDVGCCVKGNSFCDGNILTNTSENTCTGASITIGVGDCSKVTGPFGKQMVCGISPELGMLKCLEPCTPGESVLQCYSNSVKYYTKYTCNPSGFGSTYDKIYACPTGTTCQSGICK